MKVAVIDVGPVTGLCVYENNLWWALLASQYNKPFAWKADVTNDCSPGEKGSEDWGHRCIGYAKTGVERKIIKQGIKKAVQVNSKI